MVRLRNRAIRWGTLGATALLAWKLAERRRAIELGGRVVLITGGSRGLGLLLAREFARRGCRIAICARDRDELDAARAELEARGGAVAAVACDIADPDQVERMVTRVTDRFGRIDVLVNNAGIIQVGPLETMTLADHRHAMDVIHWGTVHCTLAVLPGMKARHAGRIVNITSIGAKIAVPHLLPYTAAKFAARGFSEGTRAELAKHGVLVTTVVPWLMRTGSPVNALFKGRQAREFTWFSLGDALPLVSVGADRVARRIVEAARRGEAEVTIGWQARAAGLVHDLAPGLTPRVLALVDRLLPRADGAGAEPVPGMRLATPLSPSPLTALMNRAALENNQFAGSRRPAPDHARQVGLARDAPKPGDTDR